MKATVKKKWLKALRSGEYEQTTGQLRYDSPAERPPGYCCLGVLCEVMGVKYDPDDGIPTEATLAAGGVPYERASRLASHNDYGRSFKWIAAYIERYL